MIIGEKDAEALFRLWRELDEFPACDGEASLLHALEALKSLVGAERCWWVVSRRQGNGSTQPGERWRDWTAVQTAQANGSEDDRAARDLMLARYKDGEANLFHRRRCELEGPCRVTRPSDVMTTKEWRGDWYFPDVRKPRGLDDVVAGAYAVDDRTVVHLGLDRGTRDRRFDRRSIEILRFFPSGVHGWLREQMLRGGWIEARRRLRPREREVLSLLLTDAGEKQIAAKLGLTERSTHQYVTEIYRSFAVSGRAGLAALWLRHRERGAREQA